MRNRTVRTARELLRAMAVVTFVWFLTVLVLLWIGATIVQAAADGLDEGEWASLWEYGQNGMRYFPLTIGIMLTPTVLPAYITHGITRREFAMGGSLMIVATSVGLGVVAAAGFGLENAVFRLFGQPQLFTQSHLFDDAGDVLLVVGEYAALISVHMAVGWVIGTLYYRYGGWIGTALLPLAVLPALAVEAVLAVSWAGGVMENLGLSRGPGALVAVASLAIIAGTLALNLLLIRRLAIRP